jgi:hypothetical protein
MRTSEAMKPGPSNDANGTEPDRSTELALELRGLHKSYAASS